MACFVSDGFQEALGESMTALKLGGLVLKEKQKAALYVFYRRVLESPLFYLLLYLRIMCILCTPRPIYRSRGAQNAMVHIYLFHFIYYYYYIYLYYFILFTHEAARPRNAGRK